MSGIAIITARGGSKRIPRKNIKEFCGRPIISYSIVAALESGLFDEVMVSTDSGEIADVALAYGANVPFMRSPATSDDFATTADVLREVLDRYAARGARFETFCCLYPTAPFVTADKLREASKLLAGTAETVLSVVPFSFPPQRGLVAKGNRFEYWQPEHALSRSQDLETIFHDAGQFYFRACKGFLRGEGLVGPDAAGFVVPELEAQDIDNPSDWEIAEMKYERMVRTHEQAR